MSKARERRVSKAEAANTRAGRNEKAALGNLTVAGASFLGGPAAVGTLGLGALAAAGVHSKAAKRDRAEASRTTARSNALENIQNKQRSGNTLGARLSPEEAGKFALANADFKSRGAPKSQAPTTTDRRGFQLPKVQAAAQAAKGNKYSGPTE